MNVMCLNGWGGTLHAALLPYLAQQQPDVLCLQEVVHSPQTDKDWLIYRDGEHVLPQRANLFRDVCRALPDHQAIFCPAAQGVLWDDDVALPSQWGLASFVHRSLTITGQVQGFVHKNFSADGYGEHPRSRSAHVLRLHDHRQSRDLVIAHMHGLRDLRGKMDTPERDAQAKRLLELVNVIAIPTDPVIVCGDFNVEPDSRTFDILARAGLTDLVTTRGFDGTRTSQYRKPGRFADYLLVNDRVDVKNFSVVREPEVSDHCPLLLQL